jgi:hypothetical protein
LSWWDGFSAEITAHTCHTERKKLMQAEGGKYRCRVKGKARDSNGRFRRATTRPVKALDRNIKLNQALWLLTEKMAELKQTNTGLSVVPV